jgi:hypothetical protein
MAPDRLAPGRLFIADFPISAPFPFSPPSFHSWRPFFSRASALLHRVPTHPPFTWGFRVSHWTPARHVPGLSAPNPPSGTGPLTPTLPYPRFSSP